MTTEEMRELYGSDFLNRLTEFLDDARQFDETPEKFCKRLILWLEGEGYCLVRISVIALLAGEIS